MCSIIEFLKWKNNLFSLPVLCFKEIKPFLLKLKTNGPLDRLPLLLVEALLKKMREIYVSFHLHLHAINSSGVGKIQMEDCLFSGNNSL